MVVVAAVVVVVVLAVVVEAVLVVLVVVAGESCSSQSTRPCVLYSTRLYYPIYSTTLLPSYYGSAGVLLPAVRAYHYHHHYHHHHYHHHHYGCLLCELEQRGAIDLRG